MAAAAAMKDAEKDLTARGSEFEKSLLRHTKDSELAALRLKFS
jgi:hypothetical protein